jgi:hypothetical protein
VCVVRRGPAAKSASKTGLGSRPLARPCPD